jgi:hypothetical protein
LAVQPAQGNIPWMNLSFKFLWHCLTDRIPIFTNTCRSRSRDLLLSANGKSASEERTITDPSQLCIATILHQRLPNGTLKVKTTYRSRKRAAGASDERLATQVITLKQKGRAVMTLPHIGPYRFRMPNSTIHFGFNSNIGQNWSGDI